MYTEEFTTPQHYDCAYEEINLENQTPRSTTRDWVRRAQKIACEAWKNVSAEGIPRVALVFGHTRCGSAYDGCIGMHMPACHTAARSGIGRDTKCESRARVIVKYDRGGVVKES
jgi:hypothetical protein